MLLYQTELASSTRHTSSEYDAMRGFIMVVVVVVAPCGVTCKSKRKWEQLLPVARMTIPAFPILYLATPII